MSRQPTSDRPICHVNLASGYSGGQRQTEILVRTLSERGRNQRLVVCRDSGLTERCQGLPGLDIRVVANHGLSAVLATRGCGLVHAHDGRAIYIGLAASIFYGTPYIVTRRIVSDKRIDGLRSFAYRRAARVASVSAAATRCLRDGGLAVEINEVADAVSDLEVDQDMVDAIREARAGKILIGHAGYLSNVAKGQSTIIAAAHLAANDHPDWHFLLCGEGDDRPRFEHEIGELKNIELVGWVDNIGDYLAAFDVFAFPSLKEALGSVLLDAMQFGLPIVASRVDGIPEVVEDGVNGSLFEPGNAVQLHEALAELLADQDKRAAMRRSNLEKSRDYSAAHMADAYETLYREIGLQL